MEWSVFPGFISGRASQIYESKGFQAGLGIVSYSRPVTRSENGGVRKIIIVDLTSGRRPRYEKCPLETIQPNFGLGWSPNSFALFKFLSQYHTVLRCNMQIESGPYAEAPPNFSETFFF